MMLSFAISVFRCCIPVGIVSTLVLAFAGTVASTPTMAAELLMFEQAGCPFCRAFDAEIAPDYPLSAAGKVAPLRRVNIFDDRRGGVAGLTPAYFTPTFVVLDDDRREVGRLEGYPGRKYFYPEIEAITDKLGPSGLGNPVDAAVTSDSADVSTSVRSPTGRAIRPPQRGR